MKLDCHYRLLEDPASPDRYGVAVSLEGDLTLVEHISGSRDQVLALLQAMRQGNVTPVTARDVVEDFLASL